jgi:hypothetical protein
VLVAEISAAEEATGAEISAAEEATGLEISAAEQELDRGVSAAEEDLDGGLLDGDLLDAAEAEFAVPLLQLPIPLLRRPLDRNYYDLGNMQNTCLYCGAFHWLEERKSTSTTSSPVFSTCCLDGEVSLPTIRPLPAYLYNLLLDNTPTARHFRNNLRAYNAAFAFTSVDCTPTDRGARGQGVQVFQIHGALYHLNGPLQEVEGNLPQYAQLYFHDPQYAATVRSQRNQQLNPEVLLDLTAMLQGIQNPYVSIYRTARERIQAAPADATIVFTGSHKMFLETGSDRRRENIPTSDELGLIIPDAAATETVRPIVLAARNSSRLYHISAAHPSYMPLHYVLMFPHGDRSWSPGLLLQNRQGLRQRTSVTQQVYYRYYLHPRPSQTTIPFAFYRLFQQYIVDVWALCDQARLSWIRNNQTQLRAEVYSGVADAVLRGNTEDSGIGRRIILPSSYLGSSRFISQCYQDSMAIVRRYGRPTLFITFTASPYWLEVIRELRQGETGLNRPDLICRAFYLKARHLLALIKNSSAFSSYLGHVYTIEYQKRGLPHMHLLLFLPPDVRETFTDPVTIDATICAEIPSAEEDPDGLLTEVVRSFMLHGPCGDYNPAALCMVPQANGLPPRCSKGFPKRFAPVTVVHEDGYPEYRRRNNGQTLPVRCCNRIVYLDNTWVVPYHPPFLRVFRAHINVEVCSTIHAIKYIHKYIYKGTDRAVLSITDQDEVKQYLNGRYISPSEAIWRLFEYPVHEERPTVFPLAVHLPEQQTVVFPVGATVADLAARLDRSTTTLTAFFQYNTDYSNGRNVLYQDFPASYVWDASTRTWRIRQRGTAIGRMYYCSPVQGERYYLRLLLTVVRGPSSYSNLRTFQGVQHPTFHAAAIARGLLLNDGDWVATFREAVIFATGSALRSFFVVALLTGPLADPLAIWTTFQTDLCDDLPPRAVALGVSTDPTAYIDYGLFLLERLLADSGKRLADFSLPSYQHNWGLLTGNQLIATALQYDTDAEDTFFWDAYPTLNSGQRDAFTAIVTAVEDPAAAPYFFVHGPAGTGKTFLWRCLCAYYQSSSRVVLCVASSGIAAILLPGGRTAHSCFRIPIDINDDTVCPVSPSSELGGLLRAAVLVIWDEVPMQHRYCFEAVYRMLCDVRGSTAPFGGLPMVFSGDFAQILPVVRYGQRPAIVNACIQQSSLI